MEKIKTIFIGNPEFGAIILKELNRSQFKPALVICSQDKPVGRKQDIASPHVKVAAKSCGIKALQTDDISELKDKILNIKPDLIIVAACSQIIPKEILEIPKHGCLNVHPSLLPKYKGLNAIKRAYEEREAETGVTVHFVNENQSGKIFFFTVFPDKLCAYFYS